MFRRTLNFRYTIEIQLKIAKKQETDTVDIFLHSHIFASQATSPENKRRRWVIFEKEDDFQKFRMLYQL